MSHHHGIMNSMLHGIESMCLGVHTDSSRFGRIFPLEPLKTPQDQLKKLGREGGPMDGGTTSNPSTTIPLGMVFLGQFIDHDITLDATSRLDRINDPHAIENFRTPTLDLDCIYGRGPEVSNFLYGKDGVTLLTGADGTALSRQGDEFSRNDLVRSSEGVAIIGDPRNDENRIISQLQLAFIRFHNQVALELGQKEEIDGRELYDRANEVVRWHYQWIVVHEFLPHMIGSPMVEKILGTKCFYESHRRAFIPIEFAAAAYRFGHSMAPHALRVQSAQKEPFALFGSDLGGGFSAVNSHQQVVDWSTLFDFKNKNPFQKAEKLDTKLAKGLLNLSFLPGEKSLATRNLQRGESFLLPSGENVARAIGVAKEEQTAVDQHISQISQSYDINLSGGTPLWFYILAEAEVLGRKDKDGRKPGEGLGPVGATLVGETLIGLLRNDPTSFLHQANWRPFLGEADNFTIAHLLNYSTVVA